MRPVIRTSESGKTYLYPVQPDTSSSDGNYSSLCEVLKTRTSDILGEWEQLCSAAPWDALPESHRLDALPGVLAAAIEAASKTDARNCRTAVVDAAIKHGQDRRAQGFELQVLFTEFYFLREAIWRTLRKIADAANAYEAVLPIDHALSVATRATVAGFHRREFEEQGRWAEKVEALAEEMGAAYPSYLTDRT
ncbi:MAG: hypothetical protein ACR2MQ_08680 [Gemmatimonadaceae bacterium]